MTEAIVVGAGPSGRALAHRLLREGVAVTLVDPAPHRAWRATYACWTDELPHWLPTDSIAAQVNSVDMRSTERVAVRRGYTVLDVEGLQSVLDVSDAHVIVDRTVAVHPDRVTLRSGEHVVADIVVDARGITGRGARQTAFGRIVPRSQALPVLDGAEAILMDWGVFPGLDSQAPPSFLYAIPLDDNRVLLEETCLAGDPALPPSELRRRLDARLAHLSLTQIDDEIVSFGLLGESRPWRSEVMEFGARGGLMHPATGYSVAASLQAAEVVAKAAAAQKDPNDAIWSLSARQVYRLRRAGLRSLLSFDAPQTRRFFDTFAHLPVGRQRAYLSERENLSGVLTTMTNLFTAAGSSTRGAMIRSVLGR